MLISFVYNDNEVMENKYATLHDSLRNILIGGQVYKNTSKIEVSNLISLYISQLKKLKYKTLFV